MNLYSISNKGSSEVLQMHAKHLETSENNNPMNQKKWYHATTKDAYVAINKYGVQADFNLGNELDFGHGFYLTSSLEEATKFIMQLKKETEKMELEDIPSKEYTPIVIEFELPVNLSQVWNEEYQLKVFSEEDPEFYDFVFYNRLYNKYGENHHKFDMVYGDMANSNPLKLMIAYRVGDLTEEEVKLQFRKYDNFKQLSIHKQAICDKLKITKVYMAETKKELNLDD